MIEHDLQLRSGQYPIANLSQLPSDGPERRRRASKAARSRWHVRVVRFGGVLVYFLDAESGGALRLRNYGPRLGVHLGGYVVLAG